MALKRFPVRRYGIEWAYESFHSLIEIEGRKLLGMCIRCAHMRFIPTPRNVLDLPCLSWESNLHFSVFAYSESKLTCHFVLVVFVLVVLVGTKGLKGRKKDAFS